MFVFNDNGSLAGYCVNVNNATTESQKSSIFDDVSLKDILDLIRILLEYILSEKRKKFKGISGEFCLFIDKNYDFDFIENIEYLPP